MYKLKLLLHQK